MRRSLLLAVSAASFISFMASAQNDRFAYAITNLGEENASWNALRKLDLNTGAYTDVLLNGADMKATVYNAASRKPFVM